MAFEFILEMRLKENYFLFEIILGREFKKNISLDFWIYFENEIKRKTFFYCFWNYFWEILDFWDF